MSYLQFLDWQVFPGFLVRGHRAPALGLNSLPEGTTLLDYLCGIIATLVLGAVGTVLFFAVLEYLHAERGDLGCGVFVPAIGAFITPFLVWWGLELAGTPIKCV